ncbi:hypothetical protein F0562_023759 [Nyssa sinensis]|uniref:TORTIFOLIA1/SINE1-2 N-terminal domain-containing protein n=1 Tax=Nyssa sinensis TaxID=561372 RepID=A0A5J5BLB9_9ASTE|nr:hypothetical protein F0562_023759 [Nyssa sinensis]
MRIGRRGRLPAEALTKLAVVEKDTLSEFKYACLKTFEVKRFDKVKVVRETMNQMVDAWKEIPDVSDDVLTSLQSQSSSKEDASDGHYPPDLKTSCTTTSGAPQMRRQSFPAGRSLVSDDSVTTIVRKRSPLASNDKKTGLAMFRKLDHKKPIDWKIEIAASHAPATTVVCEDDPIGRERKGEKEKTRFLEPELKQGLFNKNADDRMHKFGGSKAGSHVVPCHDETSDSTVVVNKVTEDLYWNQKESEDLSLIRKQLVQIENQQAMFIRSLPEIHWKLTEWDAFFGNTCAWSRAGSR